MIGPAAFVAAWAVGGTREAGYSSVDDAISRLAALGASTRPLMTAGFVVFGVGMGAFGLALRRELHGPAWTTAIATGASTLAVAVLPLGLFSNDTPHAVAAVTGYVTLAATPLLAARPLAARGRPGWARWSVAAGLASALALTASAAGPAHGFWQRLGLTATDIWVGATALSMLSARPASASLPAGTCGRRPAGPGTASDRPA